MSVRRGFGDETWRLATEGDEAALHRAADLLLADSDLHYEGHRARSFALAVAGRTDEALAELNEGWTDEWPFPVVYATDIARVRFLLGHYDKALDALELGVRGVERLDPAAAELAVHCVSRSPRLWWRGVRVIASGGTIGQRLRNAVAVARARFSPREPFAAATPGS